MSGCPWNWPSRSSQPWRLTPISWCQQDQQRFPEDRAKERNSRGFTGDNWEATSFSSAPSPKENAAAPWLLMSSRWSTTVAKHGKLSRGRVARMWRQKDIHAALVGKGNVGRKQRSRLHCKNKGKERRKPKPTPTRVHTHTLSDPTEAEVPRSDCFCPAYMGSVGWRFQLPNIGTHVRAGRRLLALQWLMVTAP